MTETATNNSKELELETTNLLVEGLYTAQILVGPDRVPANVLLDTGSSTLVLKKKIFREGGFQGTNLAQLKNIPFTELKVDNAFVRGAAEDASALAILETSLSLAKKLDMDIVAEGAETREDWDLVESLGFDYIQGYYCAKPMLAADLMEFIDTWTGPH